MSRSIAAQVRAGEGLLTFAARNTFRKEVPTGAMEGEEACVSSWKPELLDASSSEV